MTFFQSWQFPLRLACQQPARQQCLHVAPAINNQVDIRTLAYHAINDSIRLEERLAIFTRGLDLERNPGFRRGLAWALYFLGECSTDPAQVQELTQEALRLFRETGDLFGIDVGIERLSEHGVDPLLRLQYYNELLAFVQANGDIERIAAAHINIGFAWFDNGDYRKAFQAFEHNLRLNCQVNQPLHIAGGRLVLGFSALYTGDFAQAVELINQAQVSYRKLGAENRVAFSLLIKCLPALAEGRYPETAGFIDEAQGIYRKIGDREDELGVFIRARLARLTGETVLARKLAEELINFKRRAHLRESVGVGRAGTPGAAKRRFKASTGRRAKHERSDYHT